MVCPPALAVPDEACTDADAVSDPDEVVSAAAPEEDEEAAAEDEEPAAEEVLPALPVDAVDPHPANRDAAIAAQSSVLTILFFM